MGPRLCVLVAAVCFGTTGTAQALGPDDARAVAVGSGRIALGGALLAGVAVLAGRRARTEAGRAGVVRRPRAAMVLLAGACVAAYQLCFFAAVQKTGVAVGTVVAIGSGPAFAGALGWLVARENPGARWALATVLAAAGVTLLVAGGSAASVSSLGIALALGAGAGYASYTVISKQLLRAGHSPEVVMAGAFATGGLLLLPVLIATAGPWLLTAGGLAMVVFLAVIPTALAYVLFARGLRELTAGETATLTLAEPLTAAALGAVVLGERPGLVAVAGAGLVLTGLLALAGRPGRAGLVVAVVEPARPDATARVNRPAAAGEARS
ncbi:MAG: EamA family transporter [Solirubrobacterales bacterium]|nr:EamA family transporter [Solirubrobacterales bacterium]